MNLKRAARYTLSSLVLSALTVSAAGLLNRLPYSHTRDTISDALALPGGLIAGILYPQGPHTTSGNIGWAYVAFAGNVLFYALAWFFLIRLVMRIRNSRRVAHP
jgi:hypothetical protein